MRIKPRFLLGGGLIVLAVGYLIYTAIMNTAEYYLTVGEVQARQTDSRDRRCGWRDEWCQAVSVGIRFADAGICD